MGTLITITGPSLAGKTTLQKMLGKRGFNQIVSFTTRPKRDGEVEGVDYYFITPEQHTKLCAKGGIAESISYNNYEYGILASEVESKTKDKSIAVVVVEPHGVKQLNSLCTWRGTKHIAIWLNNPKEVLFKRFLERFKNDSSADINVYTSRLVSMMSSESTWYLDYDYDIELTQFDKSNEEKVVEKIIQVVYD